MSKLQRTTLKDIIKEVIKEEPDDIKPSRRSLNEDDDVEVEYKELSDMVSKIETYFLKNFKIKIDLNVYSAKNGIYDLRSSDFSEELDKFSSQLIGKIRIYLTGYTRANYVLFDIEVGSSNLSSRDFGGYKKLIYKNGVITLN